MIRLKKSDISRACMVKWKDARTELRAELEEFKKKGAEINITSGWIMNIEGDNLILATEKSELVTDKDLTWIFISAIVDITFYPAGGD